MLGREGGVSRGGCDVLGREESREGVEGRMRCLREEGREECERARKRNEVFESERESRGKEGA